MNIIQDRLKKLIAYLIQYLVIALPPRAWAFIFILGVAPIIVGAELAINDKIYTSSSLPMADEIWD